MDFCHFVAISMLCCREPIPVDQKPLPKEPESEEKKTKKQKQIKCKFNAIS